MFHVASGPASIRRCAVAECRCSARPYRIQQWSQSVHRSNAPGACKAGAPRIPLRSLESRGAAKPASDRESNPPAAAARLWPTTSLETTLLGDLTGEPITNTLGIVAVFSGTTLLEQRSFISDAQGRARITFSTPISQSVYVGYDVANYASQYYDRQPSLPNTEPAAAGGKF